MRRMGARVCVCGCGVGGGVKKKRERNHLSWGFGVQICAGTAGFRLSALLRPGVNRI